jgi:aquaporin Z
MENIKKKLVAECLGTFVLVFFACGVAAVTGCDINNYGTVVATALAFGLVIVAMAYSIGRISGCHINPAVTLGCMLDKRMSVKEGLLYMLAQVVGAVLGGITLFGIAKGCGLTLAGNACNTVVNAAAPGNWNAGNVICSLLIEIIMTFVFVYVILNVTSENSGAGKKAGIIIGLTLTLVHLFGINFTGTSVNPARSIGTAVAAAIFNEDLTPLTVVWVFILAPLAGGALAACVYSLLHKEKAKQN